MRVFELRSTHLAFAALALGACGDETRDPDPNPTGSTGPLYAVTTEISVGEGYQSYVVLTDSLDGGELSLDRAEELPGRARGVGPDKGGVLFASGDEAPTLTKYTLGSDDRLVKQDGMTLSFQPRGVSAISEYQSQFYFVDADTAYYFDSATTQAVVWNPEAMVLSGSIDLSELQRPDSLLFFSQTAAHVRGDKLYYPAGWLTADRTGVLPESAMVVVDTRDDTAKVVVRQGCGWARDGVFGTDGLLYLATEAYGAAAHHLDPDKAGAPCMIRFDPSTDTYDEDYLVALDDVVDPDNEGDVAGMLLPTGQAGEAYLRVLDPALIMTPPIPILVSVRAHWRWARVSLGDAPVATLIEDGPAPSSGRNLLLDVGELAIVPQTGGEPVQTVLHDLSTGLPDGSGARIQGQVFSVARIR